MTIQIDDAGWGCPVGGVVIGAYQVVSRRFAHRVLPVALFQPPAFGRRDYLAAAARAAQGLLRDLGAVAGEPVECGSGYVLGGVRAWLQARAGLDQTGWPGQAGPVGGPLQVLVAEAFLQHLHGISRELQGLTAEDLVQPGVLCWKCLRWVKGRLEYPGVVPDRERHVKTGWATWQFYRRLPYEEALVAARQYRAARQRARPVRS